MNPRFGGTLLFLEPFDASLTKILAQSGYNVVSEFEQQTVDKKSVIAIFCKVSKKIPNSKISQYPNLRFIVIPATSTDLVDKGSLEDKGVKMISLRDPFSPVKNFRSTTEIFLWHLISLLRHAHRSASAVEAGIWNRNEHVGVNLVGKVLGIVGLGRIGRQTAQVCSTMGMRVKSFDLLDSLSDCQAIEKVESLQQLVSGADVISISVDDRPSNRNLIDAQVLQYAQNVTLINTSRGFVVNEEAIVQALRTGRLSGYGADVITGEGGDDLWVKESTLWRAMMIEKLNIILTPHIGGATRENIIQSEEFVVHRFLELDADNAR